LRRRRGRGRRRRRCDDGGVGRRRGRQGRRAAAGLQVVRALGDGRPALAPGRVRRRRRRGRDQNAEGDKATQQQQAEQAITNGAKVILLTNLDSGSGAAIAANAKAQGVKVIDYDRLTLNTDATDYYVSFDNEAVGKLQGQGLVDCLGEKQGARVAVLNGSPTDNNATLFKNGYDSVINPKFESRSGRRSTTSPCPTGTTRRR
jgi:hypothetical protein